MSLCLDFKFELAVKSRCFPYSILQLHRIKCDTCQKWVLRRAWEVHRRRHEEGWKKKKDGEGIRPKECRICHKILGPNTNLET